MGTVQADISLWVQVAVSWQINLKTDADLTTAMATVNKDFDAVRADFAQVIAAS